MQNYDFKETGKRIKDLRIRHGISQTELARRVSVNRDHLGKIERGGTGISIDLAIALANEFHTTLDFIFLGKNYQSNELRREIYKVIGMMENLAEKL